MPNNDPFTRLISLLDAEHYLADIFYLLHIGDVDLESGNDATPTLLVPNSFNDVFWSSQYDALLAELVRWARPSMRESSPEDMSYLLDRIHYKYTVLLKRGLIHPIDDESDEEVASAIGAALEYHGRSLSGDARNILHRGLTTILAVSKNQAKAIVMRGRALVRLLHDP